ncbi:zinc knuckle CX2CX4HX4C containing protein [Tanacetum coccineum]
MITRTGANPSSSGACIFHCTRLSLRVHLKLSFIIEQEKIVKKRKSLHILQLNCLLKFVVKPGCANSRSSSVGGVIDEQILKSSNKNVDVIADTNDNSQLESSNGKFFSYVKAAVTANNDVNRNLFEKPTEVDGDGNEFVVFDDTIINEGCKRWDLTLCGHFVGHQMSINELRYNLKRMWGRKGFKDVVDVTNGVFFMKFFSGEGMESVVNSGPWTVNNKSFFVQK